MILWQDTQCPHWQTQHPLTLLIVNHICFFRHPAPAVCGSISEGAGLLVTQKQAYADCVPQDPWLVQDGHPTQFLGQRRLPNDLDSQWLPAERVARLVCTVKLQTEAITGRQRGEVERASLQTTESTHDWSHSRIWTSQITTKQNPANSIV